MVDQVFGDSDLCVEPSDLVFGDSDLCVEPSDLVFGDSDSVFDLEVMAVEMDLEDMEARRMRQHSMANAEFRA